MNLERIVVSGAGGFVGSALVRSLTGAGCRVDRLVRRRAGKGEIEWHPDRDVIDARALEGADAVVHLAGESIAALWTPARKRGIMESRARGTSLLARTVARLERRPRILVSASGVGYYGDAEDAILTESSPPGSDFLATVCQAWETATRPASDAGIRVVRTRFGLVLHPSGGVLKLVLPAFKLGLGAKLGNGRQWLSWIALADCVRVLEFALRTEGLEGPVNAVSPEAVRNAEFTTRLARALHRPAFLSVPAFALRGVTGGMAESLLLASQHAVPAALAECGFGFRHPRLEQAFDSDTT